MKKSARYSTRLRVHRANQYAAAWSNRQTAQQARARTAQDEQLLLLQLYFPGLQGLQLPQELVLVRDPQILPAPAKS